MANKTVSLSLRTCASQRARWTAASVPLSTPALHPGDRPSFSQIKLKASDDQVFEVPQEVALQSVMIANLVEEMSGEEGRNIAI